MSKSTLCRLTALAILSGILLTGCGSGTTPGTNATVTTPTDAPADATKAPDDATAPDASGDAAQTSSGALPAELSVFCPLNSWLAKAANDMNGCVAYQEMEKATGTKIKWIHPPADQNYVEQVGLMVLSGDLPDIFTAPWIGTQIVGGVQKYAQDGIVIELTPYLESGKMPNTQKLFEEYPVVEKQLRQDDGKLYYMSTVRKDDELRIWNGPQIRMDYLEKVNMEVPDTVDDLYNVLKAFKDQKVSDAPNFVPMMAGKYDDISQGIVQLLYSFGVSPEFYMEEGKVKFGPIEPGYKQGIEFIRKCLEEGLIDKNYASNNRDIIDAAMVNDEAGFMFNTQVTKLALLFEGRGIENPLKPIPYLRGPNPTSDKAMVFYPEAGCNVANNGLVVTTKAKDPDGAVAWIDFLYGPEGERINNFGVEGVSYNLVDGKPILTEIVTKNPQYDINTASAVYTPSKVSVFPGIQRYASWTQSTHPDGVACVEQYMSRVDTSRVLPPVSLNAEEQNEFSGIYQDIKTMINETVDRILLGQADMSELDSLVEQVKSMNIARAIELQQAALDRYNAR